MKPGPVAFVAGSFTNRRKQRLYTRTYAPKGKPGALLFVHHGLGEHCGRYDKVCRQLADSGVAVYCYDAFGHGRSEPLDADSRAFIESYGYLVDDLCDYMDSVPEQRQAQADRRPPVFLLGHSMGGLVAVLAALRRQQGLAGVMLHSPALDVEWTTVLRIQAALGSVLASLIPRARVVPAVRPEDMSQDPAVVADYIADPLNTVGPVRALTGNQMLQGFAEVGRRAGEVVLPVYVAHGTKDACTSISASRRFVEGPGGVSSHDKIFRPVESGYHELLMGPEAEACTAELVGWMRGRGASLAPPSRL
ncbi:hypothetical protein HYH03_008542 [Edaphochlamys debaryana]|uniref:Serine aminopeptidase S33 domain-containing protein n=1 Tax=Edaphochlamys debaryana TaxID=47281 RepID=A0A835Y1B2_9CHLO|nr:hypothetical protein HYH03_008542 [Edaphochlamys debaryana]|eukprot:KAG2493417.1 hypothetical protein HYH03_008542 [Edaphochlamys debaryana]